MTVTLTIPDSISAALMEKSPDPGRAALEALAAKAYATGAVGTAGVRKLLGLETKWDAIEVLSRHDVWPGVTAEEVVQDAERIHEFLSHQAA